MSTKHGPRHTFSSEGGGGKKLKLFLEKCRPPRSSRSSY